MANVLVVDDALFMRKVLKDMLVQCGHNVVAEAGDGAEAFTKYKEFKPDIVTMDITMPNVTGIDGLKLIKKLDSKATVVMCSAMGQQEFVLEAIQAGAKDFIVKPFKIERVEEAVRKALT